MLQLDRDRRQQTREVFVQHAHWGFRIRYFGDDLYRRIHPAHAGSEKHSPGDQSGGSLDQYPDRRGLHVDHRTGRRGIQLQSLGGRIVALTTIADKISLGELDVEIDTRSTDEIGDLAEAILRMKDSIQI
jgi:hypothetical protein